MKRHMDPETGVVGRCGAQSPETCPKVKNLPPEEQAAFHFDSGEEGEVRETLLEKVKQRNGWNDVNSLKKEASGPSSWLPSDSPFASSGVYVAVGIRADDPLAQPTDEDVTQALELLRSHVSLNDGLSYKSIMGDRRRTKKAWDEYYKAIDDHIRQTPELVNLLDEYARKRAAEQVYARAYKQGTAIHPDAERVLEDYWKDSEWPYGEARLKESKADLLKLREDLADGRISASRIVGTGLINPRKCAEEYIEKQLTYVDEGLRTRGRNQSVSVSNTNSKVRGMDNYNQEYIR